jgi:hypothetical protein
MNNIMVNAFIFLFDRELDKLEKEINLYPDESSLWQIAGQIANPAGNLCLHLCGNLQHYIGTQLGKTGYVRNRPAEFSSKNIPKEKLIEEILQTKKSVATSLQKLNDSILHESYPEECLGYPMTTVFFINHLFGHFGYHLGQINYHRRIISMGPKESIQG